MLDIKKTCNVLLSSKKLNKTKIKTEQVLQRFHGFIFLFPVNGFT